MFRDMNCNYNIYFCILVLMGSNVMCENRTDINQLIPELFEVFKDAMHNDQNITRRFTRDGEDFKLHIQKLKEVGGLKTHNLILKGKQRLRTPQVMIYINNPIEANLPNSFITIEKFKESIKKAKENQKKEIHNKMLEKYRNRFTKGKIDKTLVSKNRYLVHRMKDRKYNQFVTTKSIKMKSPKSIKHKSDKEFTKVRKSTKGKRKSKFKTLTRSKTMVKHYKLSTKPIVVKTTRKNEKSKKILKQRKHIKLAMKGGEIKKSHTNKSTIKMKTPTRSIKRTKFNSTKTKTKKKIKTPLKNTKTIKNNNLSPIKPDKSIAKKIKKEFSKRTRNYRMTRKPRQHKKIVTPKSTANIKTASKVKEMNGHNNVTSLDSKTNNNSTTILKSTDTISTAIISSKLFNFTIVSIETKTTIPRLGISKVPTTYLSDTPNTYKHIESKLKDSDKIVNTLKVHSQDIMTSEQMKSTTNNIFEIATNSSIIDSFNDNLTISTTLENNSEVNLNVKESFNTTMKSGLNDITFNVNDVFSDNPNILNSRENNSEGTTKFNETINVKMISGTNDMAPNTMASIDDDIIQSTNTVIDEYESETVQSKNNPPAPTIKTTIATKSTTTRTRQRRPYVFMGARRQE